MIYKSPAPKSKEIELEPDAWPRFERFIRQIAKSGPQHRSRAPAKGTKKSRAKTPQRKSRVPR